MIAKSCRFMWMICLMIMTGYLSTRVQAECSVQDTSGCPCTIRDWADVLDQNQFYLDTYSNGFGFSNTTPPATPQECRNWLDSDYPYAAVNACREDPYAPFAYYAFPYGNYYMYGVDQGRDNGQLESCCFWAGTNC